ncbi:MAG: hypothetical protein ABR501_11870 [Pyrinomonadaceae bacterium]
MKTNRTQMGFGVAAIVLSLLYVFTPASPTVQAQNRDDRWRTDDRYRNRRNRNNDGYGNYGGSFQLRQTALNAGFNEGTKDGRKALNRGRTYDFRSQRTYQQATKDYSSRFGDREVYRRYFHEAYERGYNEQLNPQDRTYTDGTYRDGRDNVWTPDSDWTRNGNGRGRWESAGNYGGSADLRQTALNAGYNEGIKQGRKDRSYGGRPDFRNNSAYQEASQDYSSRLGDRELYRRYYREGYENGYRDGLNGN